MAGYKVQGGGGGAPAPAGAANFRKDIEAGFSQSNTLTAKVSQGAGFTAAQVPATLLTVEAAGVDASTFSSGTVDTAQDTGFAANNVLVMNNLPECIKGFDVVQTYDYTGTKWVTTATNIGADNFSNVTNAEGANDSSDASRSGQALSATDGQIRCQFTINASGEKDDLDIDKVELRFYVQQSGTTLNNGGMELDWRIGSSGGWTNLATYTDNQNFMTTPDTYDITGSIASWANIRDVEARVRANLASGAALVTVDADAVLLHVEASLVE